MSATSRSGSSAADAAATGAADQLAIDDRAWAIIPPDRDADDPRSSARATRTSRPRLRYLPNVELYGVTPPRTTGPTERSPRPAVGPRHLRGRLPADLPDKPILAIAPPASSPLGDGHRDARRTRASARSNPTSRSCATSTCRRPTSPRRSDSSFPSGRRTVIPGPGARRSCTPGPGRAADRGPRVRAAPVRPAAPGRLPDPAREPDRRAARRLGARPTTRSRPAPRHAGDPRGRGRRPVERPDGSVDELVARHGGVDRHVHAAPTCWASTAPVAATPTRPPPRPRRRTAARPPIRRRRGPSPGAARQGRPADPDAPVRFAVDLLDVDESRDRARRRGGLEALGAGRRPRARGPADTRPPAERPQRPRRAVDPDRPDRRSSHCPSGASTTATRWPAPARAAARGSKAPRWAGRLMGIAFDAPLALLLLVPAARGDVALHLASRRRLGKRRRPVALVVRIGCCSWPWCSPWPGFQLVLPVDRLATCSSSTCPTRSGRRPRGRARVRARGAREEADEDVAGIVAFGSDALVERLPSELAEIDRIASTPVTSATDIGAALRLAARCSPTTPRSGSCCSRTATTRPAPARPRRRSRRPRDPGRDAPGGRPRRRDEVLVERLEARPRRGSASRSRSAPTSRSTVAQPATVRLFVNGELGVTQPVELDAGRTGSRSRSRPARPGFLTVPGRRRGRPRHVQPERPRRREHDRQGRAAGARRGRRRGRRRRAGGGARDRAPAGRHGHPRGAARRPRRARGVRLDRPRRRPAAAADRRDDGRAPGLRPRPRARAW